MYELRSTLLLSKAKDLLINCEAPLTSHPAHVHPLFFLEYVINLSFQHLILPRPRSRRRHHEYDGRVERP